LPCRLSFPGVFPKKRKFYDLERMWSELIPKERLTI